MSTAGFSVGWKWAEPSILSSDRLPGRIGAPARAAASGRQALHFHVDPVTLGAATVGVCPHVPPPPAPTHTPAPTEVAERRGRDSEPSVFGFRFLETQLLSSIISLLHTLWVTNLGDKGVESEGPPPCKPGSREPPKLLALHLVDEFLYVLLVLTKHLR